MADEEQVALLRRSREKWNAWRRAHPRIIPDLRGADLNGADLRGANLDRVVLSEAMLAGTLLERVNLRGAWLDRANLYQATMTGARLTGALLPKANLQQAYLNEAHLQGANLREANLTVTHMERAQLQRADLRSADLTAAHLTGANLTGTDLRRATLVETSFRNARLDECAVYGISAWNVELAGATQTNLCITPATDSPITVDNLEVAQFIYLMLHNQKIRQVIDTLTSKVVLILGRFSEDRKPVLDALRNALRQHDYIPVLFDFSGPESKSTSETIGLLARMARFVIADLTDPSSIPFELKEIVPGAHVPIQPLLLAGTEKYASMARDLWMAREMLPVYYYTSSEELLAALHEHVIAPAEAKVVEIQRERATAFLRSGLP